MRITIDPRRGRSSVSSPCGASAPGTSRGSGCRACASARYRVRVAVLAGKGERPLPARTLRLTVRRKPTPVAPRAAHDADAADRAVTPIGGGVFPVQRPALVRRTRTRASAPGRAGHLHEGQDISAASGTPVVAPLAGEILFNDYQHSGAGRYVILHADNGWDMMFAHLLAGSATLEPGTRVSAGQQIGLVGSTGGSTGPHLHFEIWPDGWRHITGHAPGRPAAAAAGLGRLAALSRSAGRAAS